MSTVRSASVAASAAALPLPRAAPEEAGFCPKRLARIASVLDGEVARRQLPGAVVAIVRGGKLVLFDAYGYRDQAVGISMTTDCIFNIASMTKPMTTVAALILYEEGKLQLDDPLTLYFPRWGLSGSR